MGRFIGLVGLCGCSDLGPDQVLDRYAKALGGHYSEAEAKAMRGYVDLGAGEKFDNQLEICAEVCGQSCMVNAVAGPMGGRTVKGGDACLVSERDLHLTVGRYDGQQWP
jgi:hypothetical protein